MNLTPHEQVARALKILGPEADRAAVESAVKNLDKEPLHRRRLGGFYSPRTKGEKRAAKQLRDRLRRVKDSIAKCKLVPPKPEWLKELDRLHSAADKAAKSSLRKPSRSDQRKQRATSAAARLLENAGLPRNLTRGRQFCKLAAILYGDSDVDLYHYCCTHEDRNRDQNPPGS